MTFAQWWHHLFQYGIMACSLTGLEEPVGVVIRGADGDYEVAAVHIENGVLIFDLGKEKP